MAAVVIWLPWKTADKLEELSEGGWRDGTFALTIRFSLATPSLVYVVLWVSGLGTLQALSITI